MARIKNPASKLRRLLVLWLPRIGFLILFAASLHLLCWPFYHRLFHMQSLHYVSSMMACVVGLECILMGIALKNTVLGILIFANQAVWIIFVMMAGGLAAYFPLAEACLLAVITVPISILMTRYKQVHVLLAGHVLVLVEIIILIYMLYAVIWLGSRNPNYDLFPTFHLMVGQM